ncbi:hypothetical protein CYMTET_56764 [Cymbomonas tetramitiformis]|uniref:Uncharacterized protein n=1 Tax=Cymbomonas tetramitiformis TaxID=36881 RepID=A0AAE0BBF6_9CHLO|nr:hypothetical protein CYMTET_56764 [Cymbomonas tetramitiformis]|eukprot:gene2115-2814_t
MGVKGLMRVVKEHVLREDAPVSVLSSGTRILIDGYSWAFWLLNTSGVGHGAASPVSRHHGGDYTELDEVVRAAVAQMRSADLSPEVWWDGPPTQFKARTMDERNSQRLVESASFYFSFQEGTRLDQLDYPVPALFLEQIRASLEHLCIKQVNCESEADSALARESATTGAVIYGDDSDFLLFRGCRYAPFGGILFPPLPGHPAAAVVLSRRWLANTLKVPESLLVEWAVLLGTDYSLAAHSSRHRLFQFTAIPAEDSVPGEHILLFNSSNDTTQSPLPASLQGCLGGDPLEVLEELQLCLGPHAASTLCSSDDKLQAEIDFTRALYDLVPDGACAELALRELPTSSSELGAEQQLDSFSDIALLFQVARTTGQWPAQSLGHLALHLLAGERQVGDLTNIDVIRETAQSRAMGLVLEGVRRAEAPPQLCWDDVQYADQYQQLCRRLLRAHRHTDADAHPGDEPLRLFHGPSFHSLAHELAGQSEKARSAGEDPAEGRAERLVDGPGPNVRETGGSGRAPQLDAEPAALPIDEHEQRILEHVARHRVTIICGETGCGKSSRVPEMLWRHARQRHGGGASASRCDPHIFVSQPRRIAAVTLAERVRARLGKKLVGVRLGHGVKDEDAATRLWYCTAGYLVQLAAHLPEEANSARNHGVFARLTHLVIDEVHERSIDTDLLCYWARRLLQRLPHLSLVLMSATLCTEVYQDYFGDLAGEPLFVGVRRFPLQITYLAGLAADPALAQLPSAVLDPMLKQASDVAGLLPASAADITDAKFEVSQRKLAFQLARAICSPGHSVLIFVSGISDIDAIAGMFEEISAHKGGAPPHNVIAIHSEIPFEDQLEAFNGTRGAADRLPRIVIATNAAESSITLPDCDHVICLGTEKAVEYDEQRHRVTLVPRWISRASATQRAGRTARVAPGSVWRLYSESLHASMPEFAPSEMQETPLDHIVLQLRSSLQRPVIPVLADVIDPPDVTSIGHAFASLHAMDFITEANDAGDLTPDGGVAAHLGVDLLVAKVVLYGARLGVADDAVRVAAALAQSQTPFQRTSRHVHSAKESQDILWTTLLGQEHFDAGLHSAPLMLCRVLAWWRSGPSSRRSRKECEAYGLVQRRVHQLDRTAHSLERQLGEFTRPARGATGVAKDLLHRPRDVGLLRLALVWAFRHQLVRMRVEGAPDTRPEHLELEILCVRERLKHHQLADLIGEEGTGFKLLEVGSTFLCVELTPECPSPELSAVCGVLGGDHLKAVPLRMASTFLGAGAMALSEGGVDEPFVTAFLEDLPGVGDISKVELECGDQFLVFQLNPAVWASRRHRRKMAETHQRHRAFVWVHVDAPRRLRVEYRHAPLLEASLGGLFTQARFEVVAETYQPEVQVVSFPLPPAPEFARTDDHSRGRIGASCRDSEGGTAGAPEGGSGGGTAVQIAPLLENIPFGVRFLAHCQSARKDGICVPACYEEGAPGPSAAEVSTDAMPETSFKILAGLPRLTWSLCGTGWCKQFPAGQCEKVLLRSGTLVAHSSDVDPENFGNTQYGVGASCMVIGHKRNIAVVDLVTLLPPGNAWISAALACIGHPESCDVLNEEQNAHAADVWHCLRSMQGCQDRVPRVNAMSHGGRTIDAASHQMQDALTRLFDSMHVPLARMCHLGT